MCQGRGDILFSSRVGGPAGRRRRVRIAGVAMLAVAFTAFAAAAATADDSEFTPSARFGPVSSDGAKTNWLPASMSNKVVSAMVKMTGDPVAVAVADARKQGKNLSNADQSALRASLKSKQDGIAKGLEQA